MRIRGVVALGTLVLTARVDADTYPRQPGIDVIHYVFRLSLMSGPNHQITGDTTVGIRINAADMREVALDLWFGNSVTERDWDDVWLSEGFATYFDLALHRT